MQFIKSLFCLQGFDNRPRYFAIYSVIYTLFIMLTPVFKNSIVTFFVFVVLFTLVLLLTTLRRLHDAKLHKNWLLAPSLTFVFSATVIVLLNQNNTYYLLSIPVLSSSLFLTYASSNKLHYILGYFGPVDMREYQTENEHNKQTKLRIEPTLINMTPDSVDDISQLNAQHFTAQQKSTPVKQRADIGEIIRFQLLNNKKVQLILSSTVGIIFIVFITFQLVGYLNKPNVQLTKINPTQQLEETKNIALRNHPLAMPDNYTLYLSEYDGISINWVADEVNQSTLWSQKTANGDKSCQEINFNKGEPIRTLSVQVEHTDIGGIKSNTSYYANFSPLDSQTLIQALAFRNSFTLCGYNFSLKGSQAVLGRDEQYAKWLDN